jgi:sec-independent protein translocase protein TatA
MFGLGNTELLLILFLILILFGGRQLPELARSLGEASREFMSASKGSSEQKEPKSKEDEQKEAILTAARKLGIETEGRSIEDIAKELVKATEKTS